MTEFKKIDYKKAMLSTEEGEFRIFYDKTCQLEDRLERLNTTIAESNAKFDERKNVLRKKRQARIALGQNLMELTREERTVEGIKQKKDKEHADEIRTRIALERSLVSVQRSVATSREKLVSQTAVKDEYATKSEELQAKRDRAATFTAHLSQKLDNLNDHHDQVSREIELERVKRSRLKKACRAKLDRIKENDANWINQMRERQGNAQELSMDLKQLEHQLDNARADVIIHQEIAEKKHMDAQEQLMRKEGVFVQLRELQVLHERISEDLDQVKAQVELVTEAKDAEQKVWRNHHLIRMDQKLRRREPKQFVFNNILADTV